MKRVLLLLLLAVPAHAEARTLAWTAPSCSFGDIVCVPPGCVECAVLFYPQKTGGFWWADPTVCDTLQKLPATDGQSMSYLVPLWVGYGTIQVECRDAAGNWSPPSNHVESRNP